MCSAVFELVSAYGTVGLSLGLPSVCRDFSGTVTTLTLFQANYSLSGEFSTLSKLIVCIVMLRGRHRGLPVAIDRAVLLPFEYRTEDTEDEPTATDRVSMRRTATTAAQSAHNVTVGNGLNEKSEAAGESRRRTSQWTSSPEREENVIPK